jgi:urease accessory protein
VHLLDLPDAGISTNPGADAGWSAQLHLQYARRGACTRLIHNRHLGPLAVQKSLYPEGDSVCH